MKLAASQIGWHAPDEKKVLELLCKLGFAGLEIAPTIVCGENPYDKAQIAQNFGTEVFEEYKLKLCSMQSIWFGKQGSIFGKERAFFLEYTKKAMLFAEKAGIKNLVFGCPKNRVLPEGETDEKAVLFFKELAEFALRHNCVLALEATPPMYGTNFMNETKDVFNMAKRVASKGCMVNLDIGTMLVNDEDLNIIKSRVHEISHVHISEKSLVPIEKRSIHKKLKKLLLNEEYSGYLSIEMLGQPFETFKKTAAYVAEVFL